MKIWQFFFHSPAQDFISIDGVVRRDLMGFRGHNAVVKGC